MAMKYVFFMIISYCHFLVLTFDPVNPLFQKKTEISRVTQAQANNPYNPSFLFDSKINGKTAVFLSSNKMTNYLNPEDINNLLHLTILKFETVLEITFSGFLQLKDQIDDKGFVYWGKIIDVKNLIISLNTGNI